MYGWCNRFDSCSLSENGVTVFVCIWVLVYHLPQRNCTISKQKNTHDIESTEKNQKRHKSNPLSIKSKYKKWIANSSFCIWFFFLCIFRWLWHTRNTKKKNNKQTLTQNLCWNNYINPISLANFDKHAMDGILNIRIYTHTLQINEHADKLFCAPYINSKKLTKKVETIKKW